MHKYLNVYFIISVLNIFKFIACMCGYTVHNYVQKMSITNAIYTQFAHIIKKLRKIICLYTLLYSVKTHTLHTKIMNFLSVNLYLYTLYTCTTTTTMYIINKRIVI